MYVFVRVVASGDGDDDDDDDAVNVCCEVK